MEFAKLLRTVFYVLHIISLFLEQKKRPGNKLVSSETTHLKFIYSEKATKFCEIFTLLLSYVVPVKSKGKIPKNFVVFSEYMNFKRGSAKKEIDPEITVYLGTIFILPIRVFWKDF